jgi:hypothetical protein
MTRLSPVTLSKDLVASNYDHILWLNWMSMRRASVNADENAMTISAYTRLEQMRSEIEAAHKVAVETQERAEAATNNANRIRQPEAADPDTREDVVDRVNALIEQAIPRPN